MTEETVRTVFFKNYSGGDLNEALIHSAQEICLAIIKDGYEDSESLPKIVNMLVACKNRLGLFEEMKDGVNTSVPGVFLIYFDVIRKAVVDAAIYVRDNYEIMDPWFKERFKPEHLELILSEMASSIERSAERPFNVRAFHHGEIRLYGEFFNSVLIGIIGQDNFVKYAEKYNECAKTLRRCQAECIELRSIPQTRES